MSGARHLRAIEVDENGEVVPPPDCKGCQHRDDEIAGLQRTIRSQAYTIRRLEVDREEAARNHKLWPEVEAHFAYWQEQTGHTGTSFTVDRFEVALPFVKRKKHGPHVRRAIRGIAFDHFERVNRAGRVEKFDGWETLFKSAGSFEKYVNRAPKGAS